MKKQHEWFRWISTRYIVELDSIGSDVLVFAQRWIQHTVWRSDPLLALEEENGVTKKHKQGLH